MELEKAIQRMEWRFFSSFKNIFIHEQDVLAISKILAFVKEVRSDAVEKNQAFSKLYVAHLLHLIKHYNTGVTDPILFKKLHSIIQLPLDYSIHELVDALNELEQNKILTSCGFDDFKHPNLISNSEKAKRIERLGQLIKIGDNQRKLFGKSWSFKEVKKGIMKQIKYVLDGQ